MQETSQLMDQAYQLLEAKGMIRPRDLKAAALPESYFWEMANEGRIQHLGLGLYALNELELWKRL